MVIRIRKSEICEAPKGPVNAYEVTLVGGKRYWFGPLRSDSTPAEAKALDFIECITEEVEWREAGNDGSTVYFDGAVDLEPIFSVAVRDFVEKIAREESACSRHSGA